MQYRANTNHVRRSSLKSIVFFASLAWLFSIVGCGEETTVVDTSGTAAPAAGTTTAEKRICPKCGRQYFGGELFCMYDRSQLIAADTIKAAQKVCPVCGKTYPPSKNFCLDDGSSLENVSETDGQTDTGDATQVPEQPEQPTPKPIRIAEVPAHTPRPYQPQATPRPYRPQATPRPYHSQATPKPYRPQPTPRPVYNPPPTPRPVHKPPPTPIPPKPTPRPVAKPSTPVPMPVEPTPKMVVAKVPPPNNTTSSKPAKSLDELFADLEAVSARASQGKLSASEASALDSIPPSDEKFVRSRALLAMNYKNRNNEKYYKALTELMSLPENTYNPIYNLELAEYYLVTKSYEKSSEQAKTVDRFKQRFPPAVYFQSVARMYEVQAKAFEGQFNETEDIQYLDKAIRTWQRYISHVSKKGQDDRVKMAEDYVAKLEKIKRRME